jgi:hypothetical protein
MAKKVLVKYFAAAALIVSVSFLCIKPESDPSTLCEGESASICFGEMLTRILRDKGLEHALDRMAELSDSNERFRRVCHDNAHILGREAFNLYESGRKFDFDSKASYCSYGFYHGFIEDLLVKRGDYKSAGAFCEEMSSTSSLFVSDECYHGIGHGVVDSYGPEIWAAIYDLENRAVNVCSLVSKESLHKYERCLSGVYNGISDKYLSGGYGLKVADNPFALCEAQDDQTAKQVCYGFFTRLTLMDGNIDRAIKSVQAYVPREYVSNVIENLMVIHAGKESMSYDDVSIMCDSFDSNLKESCIRGFSTGLVQKGVPEKEHEKAFEFCSIPSIKNRFASICINSATDALKNLYTKEKLMTTCSFLEDEAEVVCLSNL